MVVTDVLRLNPGYPDGESIVLIRPEVGDIVERVLALHAAPDRLAAIGEAGWRRGLELFAPEIQIGSRMAVLREAAGGEGLDLGLSAI
jgi:hypothetical protein